MVHGNYQTVRFVKNEFDKERTPLEMDEEMDNHCAFAKARRCMHLLSPLETFDKIVLDWVG